MVVSATVTRDDGSEVKLGDRLSIDESHYGTIKFIGSVPTTEGIWLGVDWDTDGRGKHDGSKDGIKYFDTRQPTSGSFIRANKVNLGVSCLAAIEDRYGKEDETGGVNEDDLYVVDDRMRQTVVEMVGAKRVNERQSQLHLLRAACLSEMHVHGCISNKLSQAVPNITELDLSKNLICHWNSIADIAHQLPRLQSLNVSDNKLQLPEEPESLASSFSQLHTACLNRLNYSWNQILQCALMFPRLQDLHACFNDLTNIDTIPDNQLLNVALINLDGNKLNDWREILKLKDLPCLKDLIVTGNGITSLEFPGTEHQNESRYFTSLTDLTLNENNISDWQSIGELNKLKSLQNLRISRNPINASQPHTDIRSQIIARIANLRSHNRNYIDPVERRGAEYDYVKANYKEWKSAGGDVDPANDKTNEQFARLHPRLPALVRLHGEPESSELIKQITNISSNLISVTISDFNQEFKKKLPIKMTVEKLCQLVQKIFKNDKAVRLYNKSYEVPDLQYKLDHPLRELSYYSIENNDTIYVYFDDPQKKINRRTPYVKILLKADCNKESDSTN